MYIGCMVWRIGETVDFYQQVAWLKEHGFEEVSFHTRPGQPGVWDGFDVKTASPADVARLRRALTGFRAIDVHAPFDAPAFGGEPMSLLYPDRAVRQATIEELAHSLRLAGEIGADVVVVHPRSQRLSEPQEREQRCAILAESVRELDDLAQAHGVRVGLEMEGDYDVPAQAGTERVGITLDTGHVCFREGAGYREYGSIGGLVRHLGERLYHVHIHDYDGVNDHIALGKGKIDFPELAAALTEIGYQGSLCLELNPASETPADILASREYLKKLMGNGLSPP